MRAGTENIASIVGMAVALKKNYDNLEVNTSHVLKLERTLLDTLANANVDCIRNSQNMLPGIISLSFPEFDGETIMHRLAFMRIQVSTGSACDSVNTQIWHVLKALELSDDVAKGTIRISIGKYNTEEDIEAIAEALIKIVNKE